MRGAAAAAPFVCHPERKRQISFLFVILSTAKDPFRLNSFLPPCTRLERRRLAGHVPVDRSVALAFRSAGILPAVAGAPPSRKRFRNSTSLAFPPRPSSTRYNPTGGFHAGELSSVLPTGS